MGSPTQNKPVEGVNQDGCFYCEGERHDGDICEHCNTVMVVWSDGAWSRVAHVDEGEVSDG